MSNLGWRMSRFVALMSRSCVASPVSEVVSGATTFLTSLVASCIVVLVVLYNIRSQLVTTPRQHPEDQPYIFLVFLS